MFQGDFFHVMTLLSMTTMSCTIVSATSVHSGVDRQPVGIVMCGNVCKSLYGCTRYQYNPANMMCSAGVSKKTRPENADKVTIEISKAEAGHRIDVESTSCVRRSTIIRSKGGLVRCVDGTRRKKQREIIFELKSTEKNIRVREITLPPVHSKLINRNKVMSRTRLRNPPLQTKIKTKLGKNTRTKSKKKILTNNISLTQKELGMRINDVRRCHKVSEYCKRDQGQKVYTYLLNLCKSSETKEFKKFKMGILRKYITDGNCSLTRKGNKYETVLHLASLYGFLGVVRCALYLPITDVDTIGLRKRTPIMMSALGGHEHIFKLLLKAGSSLNLKDKYSDSILHLACKGGSDGIVRILLQKLKDIHMHDLNVVEKLQMALAEHEGNDDICKLLRRA